MEMNKMTVSVGRIPVNRTGLQYTKPPRRDRLIVSVVQSAEPNGGHDQAVPAGNVFDCQF
jgi:hypothetical protein